MKTSNAVSLLVALLTTGVASATKADVDPLGAVYALIEGLRAKIVENAEVEAKAYKEYYEWCDEASANTEYSIKTSTSKKEGLEAKIGELNSDIEVGTSKIEELSASVGTAAAELKEATAVRKQEAIDFAASEKELLTSINTLDRAIAILEKEMATSSAAFAQIDTKNLESVVQTLSTVVEAAAFSSADRQKLVSLVETQQEQAQSEDEDEPGAPASAKYENNSGSIVDVLEELKDKAEAELAEARKAEAKSKHDFEMVKQSLSDKEKADIAALTEEKSGVAAAKEELGVAQGDLSVTDEDLKTSKESLKTTRDDCMRTANDHEATVASQKQEIKVIMEAEKVLKASTGAAGEQTYSFLQASSKTSSRTLERIAAANSEVVAIVKKLAKSHHSPALNQLASKIAALVQYQSFTGEDPFKKVKGLIVEMIAKLEKEATAEATEKAYCDEEMSKTEKKKSELEDDVDKLSSKIDKATARSADLKEDIATLQADLAALAKTQAEIDEVRSSSHQDYEVAKKELTEGIAGVRKALGILREYYGSSDDSAAMLQDDEKFGAFMQQPKAPEKFEKATGAGGSIISILGVIESDFATNLAKEETEEADESTSYEEITQQNKVSAAKKSTDVKLMTGQVASLEKRISEMTGDKDSVSTELKAVDEYYAKLRERCVAKPASYKERKQRRDAEISGLKEALNILESEAALLQKKHRRGRRAGFMQVS